MERVFKVGLTKDCIGPNGDLIFDPAALDLLKAAPRVEYEIMPDFSAEITPEQAATYDALVVIVPRVTAATLAGPDLRAKAICRFGVGYDSIDVDACTRAGVILTITPDGVRRPMATVILTFILALAQNLLIKNHLTKSGRWHERTAFMGNGLTGKTVGSIGFGNIARDAFRLLRPLDMRHIAYDPAFDRATAAEMDVREVSLDTVLAEADFVCVNCPLTPATRNLISRRELALMRPGSYLINTARGPIVDEAALYTALIERRIAGAALDVFAQEPTPADNPLLALDNVIATPHALGWTDECFRGMAEAAFRSALAIAGHHEPSGIVNRAVLEHPNWAGLR